MFSQNQIDDGECSGRAMDADAVAERESLRSLLARPFYWLGFVAFVFLFICLWSAEHVEEASAMET